MSVSQEAAFQLYRPIIARVIPPTPEPAKVGTKPEEGEVAAEEGEIEVPKPAAPEPGAVNDDWRQSIFISSRLAVDVSLTCNTKHSERPQPGCTCTSSAAVKAEVLELILR